MKRFIVVVAFALSAAPALADVGAPFEQKELDRALPNVGLVLLVHAQSVEEAQRALASCFPYDLRVETKEVQYCEENLARFDFN